MRQPGRLGNRQRVHIGAERHHPARAGGPPLDDTDNPGLPDPGFHDVATKGAQPLGHQGAGAALFEPDLGMGMDVTAPFGDLILQLGKSVSDRHRLGPSQAAGMRRSTISANQLHPAGMISSLKSYSG